MLEIRRESDRLVVVAQGFWNPDDVSGYDRSLRAAVDAFAGQPFDLLCDRAAFPTQTKYIADNESALRSSRQLSLRGCK
jgi:hypothetical protein